VRQYLLPKEIQREMLPAIYAVYRQDLDHTFESFENEAMRAIVRV
jgi:hypothetical protein